MKPSHVRCENYISFQIEWDMVVLTVFLLILNQMEFHFVQNRKENYHHDRTPFDLKGNGNIVFSVCCFSAHLCNAMKQIEAAHQNAKTRKRSHRVQSSERLSCLSNTSGGPMKKTPAETRHSTMALRGLRGCPD